MKSIIEVRPAGSIFTYPPINKGGPIEVRKDGEIMDNVFTEYPPINKGGPIEVPLLLLIAQFRIQISTYKQRWPH